MKIQPQQPLIIRHRRNNPGGYTSLVLVISTCVLMSLLMVFAFRASMDAQAVQGEVQMHIDYSEKEETILRAIVAITPNRAIGAMRGRSDLDAESRNENRWSRIFREALDLANAHNSMDAQLASLIMEQDGIAANVTDSRMNIHSRIFMPVGDGGGWVASGARDYLGPGFPPMLDASVPSDRNRDRHFPIISHSKHYGERAQAYVGASVDEFPQFNLLTYPDINFGYARPGEPFVAKHNWWAFDLDLAGHDQQQTGVARRSREMVMSIYEVPSQLAISAGAFMSLGEHASGERWTNATIEGNIFAGRATVAEGMELSGGLSGRRGLELATGSSVGGRTFDDNPFTPGTREIFLATEGDFFPVSMPSESGRAAFIPINRGADFFDRFAHEPEQDTISTTSWNEYSIGALQCAMRLDITEVVGANNPSPTKLRFSYLANGERQSMDIPLNQGPAAGLPPGYLYAGREHQSYDFGSAVVDLAYGENGVYAFETGATGLVTFNNARFGDPLYGVLKSGYFRPSYPFEIRQLVNGRIGVMIYPQRFPAFLRAIGADGVSVNHSLVVNVDYPGNPDLIKPSIPSTDHDYAVVLEECRDLTAFARGFSLVSNLRLYIADDFNTVPGSPPAGYDPDGDFFPPASLFVPEMRYGLTHDPLGVRFAGQIGSVAAEDIGSPIRPLDSLTASGQALEGDRLQVNLRPIRHPAELPPITMMNWLVLLQERRAEFQAANP